MTEPTVKIEQSPIFKISVATKDGSAFNFDIKGANTQKEAQAKLVVYLEEVIALYSTQGRVADLEQARSGETATNKAPVKTSGGTGAQHAVKNDNNAGPGSPGGEGGWAVNSSGFRYCVEMVCEVGTGTCTCRR